MDLEFTFDNSPLVDFAESLQPGDVFPAEQFLTMAAREDRETVEQALDICGEKGAIADVSRISAMTGQAQERLLLEQNLAKQTDMTAGLDENDPLRLYLQELSGIPATGDVQMLAQLHLEGKEQVEERLVNLCLSAVVELSRDYAGKGVLLMDLIQEGSLGLWQGIAAYRGGDFEKHIHLWIKGAMANAVLLQACENGLGDKLRSQMEDYRDVDQKLLSELGRNPTIEEIAEGMHITAEEAMYVESMVQSAQSLSRAKQPEKEEIPEEEDQAVENTAYFQSRQLIFEMLSGLNELEKEVIGLRYGLDTGNAISAQQVAVKLGISPEQVMKIEADALFKMRNQGN